MRREKRRGAAKGATGLVCERDGNATALRCAKCSRPICPQCLVQTPVGFTCDGHGGKPVYRADDLPLTPHNQPLRRPGPQPSAAPMLVLLAAPVLLMVVRVAMRGGSTGAGLVLAVPAIALAVWFVVRRFGSRSG